MQQKKYVLTMLRFSSSKPQRRKKRLPHSSLRTTLLQMFSANHLIMSFWGRKFFLPNRSCRDGERNAWSYFHTRTLFITDQI